jgi:hypothetical protein
LASNDVVLAGVLLSILSSPPAPPARTAGSSHHNDQVPDSSRRERYLEEFRADPHVPKLTARDLELPEDVVASATLAGCPCARTRSAKLA